MLIKVRFCFFTLLIIFSACNGKNYKPHVMKVGEVVTVPGMKLVDYQKTKMPLRKNVLLLLNKGGMHLDVKEDFKIEVFQTAASPVATYTSAELRDMHDKTGCSTELKNYLISAAGAGYVLFCNGSIDIEKISKAKLYYEGKTKEATSVNIFFSNSEDELVGGSLFFY